MKIGLVGSTGGHLADLYEISQLLTEHKVFFVSFFAPNLTSFSEAPIFLCVMPQIHPSPRILFLPILFDIFATKARRDYQ